MRRPEPSYVDPIGKFGQAATHIISFHLLPTPSTKLDFGLNEVISVALSPRDDIAAAVNGGVVQIMV